MICGNCKKKARKSNLYPSIFVCDCLGYLEDIKEIDNYLKSQVKHTEKRGKLTFIPPKNRSNVMAEIKDSAGNRYVCSRDLVEFIPIGTELIFEFRSIESADGILFDTLLIFEAFNIREVR